MATSFAIAPEVQLVLPLGVRSETEVERRRTPRRSRDSRQRDPRPNPQQILQPAEWFAPPPAKALQLSLPAARVFRLQILAPLPCASCAERVEPGSQRRRLSRQMRDLKRRDFERPLRGACALPCAILEARLDANNPCQGCFHRETCKSACHVLEKLLPRAVPTYYDEVPVQSAMIEARAPEAPEPESTTVRWRWADFADEVRPQLERAIRHRLTDQQRRAMEMHLRGMSGVSTAKAMGVSKVTVHWLLVRAKRRIAEFFQESRPARKSAREALSRTICELEVE
jgi:hypothetical protein